MRGGLNGVGHQGEGSIPGRSGGEAVLSMGSELDYGESYYRDRETWLDFRMEVSAMLALARLTSGARVLEVGCGGGELLRRLPRGAHLAVGADLSVVALRLALGRVATEGRPAAVLRASAEMLPFSPGAFDVVLAQHLLEHMPDPVEALREWRRVLCPGGRLVLVTPNAAYPDPTPFADPSHRDLLTPASLRSALESAGFKPVHLSTLFPYLGRGRLARAASIRLAPVARHVPGLALAGRSIVAAGTSP